jgi:hypothetical protein
MLSWLSCARSTGAVRRGVSVLFNEEVVVAGCTGETLRRSVDPSREVDSNEAVLCEITRWPHHTASHTVYLCFPVLGVDAGLLLNGCGPVHWLVDGGDVAL